MVYLSLIFDKEKNNRLSEIERDWWRRRRRPNQDSKESVFSAGAVLTTNIATVRLPLTSAMNWCPFYFFSLLLIIFYSFKKFSIAWMNLFFKFWVFSHLNVKSFYKGFQGIGSCLWRRKCWLDGFDFRSGSSWWQTCFRVTGYLQSLQINQAVWFYRFDNKFVFIFFSYCQFFIHRIIPKALMKKEVCNEYIYLAPSL